jgi:phenylacetate-CoA ligase
MKHLGVNVVRAFPSFAMKLADIANKMGINPRRDLKVRLLIIGGETYPDELKANLAEEFGAEVRAMYGGAETGFVASECSVGGGMHCFSPSIVEIIDPITRDHVAAGQPGEIVTTDLSRKGLPLIRYRTGDITAGVNAEPCPCGRTSPRLGKIIGRSDSSFWVKGVLLTPNVVKEVLQKHRGVGSFQIIVSRDQFMDNLMIKVEFNNQMSQEGVREAILDDLRAVTRLRAEITLVAMGSLEKEPVGIDLRQEVRSRH